MKRFSFRLETLLRLRQRQQEDCQCALAAAQVAVRLAHHALEQAHTERRNLDRDWSEWMRRRATGNEGGKDFELYRAHLENTLAVRQKAYQVAWEGEQTARTQLLTVMRKKRILEKLKERQELRHRTDQFKREQQQLEERGIGHLEGAGPIF